MRKLVYDIQYRTYIVLDVNTAPLFTDLEWEEMESGLRLDSALVLDLQRQGNQPNYTVSMHKRSRGAGVENRYCLFVFDISNSHVLDTLADAGSGIGVGTPLENQTARVIENDIRNVGQAMGFQRNKFNVVQIFMNADVDIAISETQTYLANNPAIWYADEN